MQSSIKFIISIIVTSFLLSSCNKNESNFEVVSFNPIKNEEFQSQGNLVSLQADLSNAPIYGIAIPTSAQCKAGKFIFDFTLKYTSANRERLFYKIYYQNESYKIPDENWQSYENFYGSWEDVSVGFKPIDDFDNIITITDSISILGNPRDEKIYYGSAPEKILLEKQLLQTKIDFIKSTPDWYAKVVEKATKQRIKPEEQIYLDALWSIDYDRNADKSTNNRWKRNPRVGEYKFMLVVVNEKGLRNIPTEVKNIGLLNSDHLFVNPFGYFKLNESTNDLNKKVIIADKKLKVKAKMDLGSGILISSTGVNKSVYSTEYYNSNCGDQEKMVRKAHFTQYFHYINRHFPLKNIPEIIDVMDPSFTKNEYEKLKTLHEQSKKFVYTYVNSSDCPCKTVSSDSINKTITLVNPGNKPGEHKKEHVGVMGRIGFTFGKWRAKIKFPELINKNNIWNGLTNAFWLLGQEGEADWNLRRPCNAEIAYIPKNEGDNEAALWKSKPQLGYSEIDFEILKESQYWPVTSYPGKKVGPSENAAATDDITVTCTNWDLACHEPKNFNIGAKKNIIDEMEFVHHRWNPWYKALTTKVPAKNKEVFGGDYYYFEIEWLPEKIIWRIGPEKNKMRIVCIMNNEITAIPNNQMVAIVTQEWHNQEWWPMAPFKQNFIPFPKNNLIGKVLEIEVE